MATKSHKKKHMNKVLKTVLIILGTLAGVLLIFIMVYAGSILKLRKNAKAVTSGVTADTFRQIETSIVYDIDGEEITSLSGTKDLHYISSSDMPDILKRAFVITEDRDFYSHHGVDLSAIIRAAVANVKHNAIKQGASTITQQLAKNMFLTQDVTWERKITEMFAAMELEKKFSKEQILEFYINNIYYANGYYGIEAAAQGYFGKSVNDLSLSQLIFLVAIPNNPSKYDPVNNLDAAKSRRDLILKQLYAEGEISGLDYYSAIEEKIELVNTKKDRHDYVETYVFYCATRALMEKNGFVFKYEFSSDEDEQNYNDKYDEMYSEYQASLFTGGYRIYTAIDMDKENLLQQIVDDKMRGFTDVNDEGIYKTQAAAVCIDNSTGLVTAIVGGRSQDHNGYTLNRAYQSFRQPGSSIKPVNVYAPYLMSGHTPDEKIDDSPILDGPHNVGDEYRGEITLTEALAWSSNVCAWKIMGEMTPEYGMSFLHLMDFKKSAVDDNNQAAAIGGFTVGVSPVELASAYATLENDGVYRNPTCIDKITNAKGSIIVDNTGDETRVYTEEASRMVTKMLEYGVNKGILTSAIMPDVVVAAKSGTTNDYKDGWLAGYSRYYTTVVWAGNDNPATVDGLSGGTYPLYIWKEYMEKIHKGLEKKTFPEYDGESDMINDATEHESQAETETETHPGYGGSSMNISDGDRNTNVSGMGDKNIDVSGMGDKDAPR